MLAACFQGLCAKELGIQRRGGSVLEGALLAGAPPPPTKKGLRKTGADRAADAAARSPSVLLQGGGPDSAAFEPAFEAKLLEKLRHVFGQLSSVCGDPESPRNGSLVREMLGRFGPGPARVRGTRAAPSQPCPQPASLACSHMESHTSSW